MSRDEPARADRVAEARRLRAEEGWSRRRIAERLGVSTGTLTDWLRGVEPPPWTKRPNAKDAHRERARELRASGYSVPEIAQELGVARSSAYQWVRDIPLDPSAERRRERRRHARMMAEARWSSYRRDRDRRRDEVATAAGHSLPVLSDAELLRLGALVYWCEGEKAKPWRRTERVAFVNSDPGLVELFVAFLRVAGVAAERIRYRVMIHESADGPAAVVWWAERVGAPGSAFLPTTYKRHNPKTVRHNTGEGYRGCLVVSVLESRELYWRIEGMVDATVRSAAAAAGRAVKLDVVQTGGSE